MDRNFQVDSFDPKPQLAKENGQKPKFKTDATVFNSNGVYSKAPGSLNIMEKAASRLATCFHIGSCADELCVVRSMTALSLNHPNANYAYTVVTYWQADPAWELGFHMVWVI